MSGANSAAYNSAAYRHAKRAFAGLPCWKCGAPSDSVDHVLPLALGGSPDLDNLAPVCLTCNLAAGGRLGMSRRTRKRRGLERNPRY